MSTPDTEPIGWSVITPEGDVVDSGPVIVVKLVALAGAPEES